MADELEQAGLPEQPDPQHADLGILLTLALRGFVTDLHAGLAASGFADVRPPFGVVFRALRDGPLTLTELASQLGVTKQAAAKVVDEMVAKGLLRRRPSPADARAKLLELTGRGTAAMATAIEIGARLDARLQAAAGTVAVDSMRAALEALVELTGLRADLERRRSPALWDGQ